MVAVGGKAALAVASVAQVVVGPTAAVVEHGVAAVVGVVRSLPPLATVVAG